MRRHVFALALLAALTVPAAADEVLRLPGMHVGGTIARDSRGIPHITGFTEWDAHFLTGYAQAQDRLFQMDYYRREASGTLAELLGPAALSSDVQLRAIGLRRTASSSMNILSAEGRAALEAYAAGVNAWALNNPLPPEYAALELTKFVPWTALDSLAFANLFLLGQFFDDSDAGRTQTLLTYQGTGAVAGFDGTKLFFEDLARFEPFDHTTTLPAVTGSVRRAENRVAQSGFLAQVEAEGRRLAALGVDVLISDWLAKVDAAPYFKDALNRGKDRGSNEWDRERPAPLARLAVHVVPDGRAGRTDQRDGHGSRGRAVRPRGPDAVRRLGRDEQPDGRHGHVRRRDHPRLELARRVRDDVQGRQGARPRDP
jgi:penicillin amidase